MNPINNSENIIVILILCRLIILYPVIIEKIIKGGVLGLLNQNTYVVHIISNLTADSRK